MCYTVHIFYSRIYYRVPYFGTVKSRIEKGVFREFKLIQNKGISHNYYFK